MHKRVADEPTGDPRCAGRLPHKSNTPVQFDLSAQPAAPGGGAECDLTAWPEFHAGTAGGLRAIPPSSRIIRTWLLLRKPPAATYSHAGILFALGLRGELRSIAAGNLYRYLSQEHTATTIGMLLGLGASFRGSMQGIACSTLLAHTPKRSSTFGDLELSPMTQAAAMVGLGLVYEGSGHWETSEMLLHEISRRPESSNMVRPPVARVRGSGCRLPSALFQRKYVIQKKHATVCP